jgi:hypothetical protein
MKVLLIGASKKPERYAYMAMKRLLAAGHEVMLFNPALDNIDGYPVYKSLAVLPDQPDTVTLYVGAARLIPLINDIIQLAPRRIISNPGTECPELRDAARTAGIDYLEACTLVMLGSNQF